MWLLLFGILAVGTTQVDLVDAAAAGDTEQVLVLLGDGADPNGHGPRGVTPLIAAAARGHATTVRALLQAGADVHAVDASCRAAIDVTQSRQIVAVLEDSGASFERSERRNAVYAKIAASQRLRGQPDDQGSRRVLEEAEQMAIALGNRSVLVHVEINFVLNAALSNAFAEAHARLAAARKLDATSYCPGLEPELLYQEGQLASTEALRAVGGDRVTLARAAAAKLEQAITLFGAAGVDDRASEAEAQLGYALLTAGEPQRAVALLDKFVRNIASETPFTAGAHHALSDAYWDTNNRETAITELEHAYALRLRFRDPQVADSGVRLAQRLGAVGRWPEAQERCRSSLEVRERLRASLPSGQWRIEYLQHTRPHYQSCIDSYLKGTTRLSGGRDVEQTLLIGEQARARALLEAVASPQRGQLASALLPRGVDDVRALARDGETVFLEYFLDQAGSYAWIVGNGPAAPVTVIRLPDRAAIERVAGDYLARLDKIDGRLSADETPEQGRQGLEGAARALSDLVLAPIAGDLPVSADRSRPLRLMVVADGLLQRIPFNALPWRASISTARENAPWTPVSLFALAIVGAIAVGRRGERSARAVAAGLAMATMLVTCSSERTNIPERLIDRFEVVNIPSAAVWNAIEAQRPLRRAERGVMVIADPRYESAAQGQSPLSPIDLGAERVNQILARAPMATTADTVLMEEHANREAFLNGQLANYRHLVVAAHAQVDYDTPLNTRILLSNVDRNGRSIPQNAVFLSDVYRMRLNADLVFLAMCSASTGRERRGEGLNSLARGVLQAGAANVVATLWDVGTSATVELLVDFYNQLSEGERLRQDDRRGYGLALRAAQLKLRSSRPSDYYWAAYVLHGG